MARKRVIASCCSALTWACERCAACSRKRSAISPALRPPTGGDAGDGEQIFDQRLGAGVVGALERRQHARLGERALTGAIGEDRRQRAAAREAAADAAQPEFGQSERRQRAVEQPRVADLDLQRPGAGEFGGFQRQPEDFRVGGFDVVAAIAFEPGLRHLAALAWAGAEDRAEIGVLGEAPRFGRSEIGEADRDRVVGPQAQFRAGGVAGEVEAAADILARHVEEHRGRLQHRRLEAREAGGEEIVERPRSGLERGGAGGGEARRGAGGRVGIHGFFLVFAAFL